MGQLGIKPHQLTPGSGSLVCLVLAGFILMRKPRYSNLQGNPVQKLWILVLYRPCPTDIYERVSLMEAYLKRRWETYDPEKELGCTLQELRIR